MAIDQRNISASLRMMGDRALQQYAAMHKNDPYIFPLAFQESQNRQAVHASKAAQMAGREMPKVNDAALMAMTPQSVMTGSGGTLQTEYGGPVRTGASEGQGISNLPAPNMRTLADGGIAGYEDDEEGMATGGMGGMFNFAQQSEPVVRMSGGGVTKMSTGGDVDAARARRRVAQDALYRYGLRQRLNDPEGFQAAQSELSAAEDELKATEASYATEIAGSNLNRPATGRKDVGLAATEASKEKYPPSEATRVKDFPGVKPGFEFSAETSDAPPVKTGTKTKAKTKVEPPTSNVETPVPTDTLTNLGIVPYGQSKVGDAPPAPAYTPKTAEETREKSEALAAPELAKIQASYKPFGEQFAQDRSRIDTREKNMLSDALIRGGLKTMAGKSQFAMQNLGEGGLEALNVYQETQKTNDAARKALTQSEMLMSQAQRAEERGARGEAVSLFAQAEKAEQVGLQFQQKAQEMANTKQYQQGVLLHYERADKSGLLSAEAQMTAAKAAQTRANAVGGNAGDKHIAVLARVQAVLNTNPEYKEAAKFANLPGKMGDSARATIKRMEQQVYSKIAPEMLQSKQDSPSGSGGGQNVLDFNSIK